MECDRISRFPTAAANVRKREIEREKLPCSSYPAGLREGWDVVIADVFCPKVISQVGRVHQWKSSVKCD